MTLNIFYREAGVGFASSPPHVAEHDYHRAELLKLLLTCFSEAMYLPPAGKGVEKNPACINNKKRLRRKFHAVEPTWLS